MGERYVRPPLTATEPPAGRTVAGRGRPARALRLFVLLLVAALVVAAVVAAGLAIGHHLHGDDEPGVGALSGSALFGSARPVPAAA